MGRRKKQVVPVDASELHRENLISRAQAFRSIANRIRKGDDGERQHYYRARQRIISAVEKGRLPEPICGKFVFGELAAWAQDTWPGKFNDWQATRISTGGIRSTLDGVSADIRAVQLPADLPTCHSRVIELVNELAVAYRESESLRSQVAELRTFKIADEKSRRGKQIAAQKPRGARTK